MVERLLHVVEIFPGVEAGEAGSALFTFSPPLVLGAGTHSMVITADDPSGLGAWSMRQLDNTGQQLTVDTITFGSLWGWYGSVDIDTGVEGVVITEVTMPAAVCTSISDSTSPITISLMAPLNWLRTLMALMVMVLLLSGFN